MSRAVTIEEGTPVEGSRLANFERTPTPMQQSTFVAGEIEADSSVNVRQARHHRAVTESAAGFPGIDEEDASAQVESRRTKTMEISASIVIDEYATRSDQSRATIASPTQSAAMIRPPTSQITAKRPATPPITIQTFVMPDEEESPQQVAPATTPMAAVEPTASNNTPRAGIVVVDDGDVQP